MITRVPVAIAISVLPKNIDAWIFENQQISSITFSLFGYSNHYMMPHKLLLLWEENIFILSVVVDEMYRF